MSILGRPSLPEGVQAIDRGCGFNLSEWEVGYYDSSGDWHRLGHTTFTTLTGMAMYRDWCNGVGPLDWNVNGAGMPV